MCLLNLMMENLAIVRLVLIKCVWYNKYEFKERYFKVLKCLYKTSDEFDDIILNCVGKF